MCETKLVCAYANSSKHFLFFCIRLVRGLQLRMRHGACLQVPFQFRSKGHLHRMANSADVPKILHSVCWNVNSGRS